MHIQILRAQCIAQGFRFLTPLIIQLFMVQQGNHRLITQRGEVINLEQLVAQNGIITHTRNHRRHQLVDEFTGGGEAIHADTAFGLLIENDVIQVIAIVPDAELRTHPVMTDRRAKHFRNQVRKRCHHTLQTYHFFG